MVWFLLYVASCRRKQESRCHVGIAGVRQGQTPRTALLGRRTWHLAKPVAWMKSQSMSNHGSAALLGAGFSDHVVRDGKVCFSFSWLVSHGQEPWPAAQNTNRATGFEQHCCGVTSQELRLELAAAGAACQRPHSQRGLGRGGFADSKNDGKQRCAECPWRTVVSLQAFRRGSQRNRRRAQVQQQIHLEAVGGPVPCRVAGLPPAAAGIPVRVRARESGLAFAKHQEQVRQIWCFKDVRFVGPRGKEAPWPRLRLQRLRRREVWQATQSGPEQGSASVPCPCRRLVGTKEARARPYSPSRLRI
jgi:hypothetical protein